MLLIFVLSLATSILFEMKLVSAAVGIIRPDGDITTTFANCTGTGCSSGYYAAVNETVLNTSNYVSTGTSSGGDGDEVEFSMTSVAGATDSVSRVEVKFQADVEACRLFGSSACDILDVRIYINGAYQSAQTFTM